MLGSTQFIHRPFLRIKQFFPVQLTLLLLISHASTAASASSAAETDWKKSESSGQCRGNYIQPQLPELDPGQIEASAANLLHVKDHSTSLSGNIRLRRGNQVLESEFVTIDAATEVYTAEGEVLLRQPDILLQGERISGNLVTGIAAIDSASFLLHKNRLRGTATRITKTEQNVLVLDQGEFTTCEPGSNTWSLRGKKIELKTEQGHGVARDVTLRIKGVPVAYLPYFRFPIDDSRQSGFLAPGTGHDSEGGTDITVPYYFNIAPNLDATYTLRSVWKRGVMHEGELRFLNGYASNTIAGTYLPSDDEYDDRLRINTENPGKLDEQDRWLVHISHKGRSGPWASSINYTSVSDIDYFHDLGGFTQTDIGGFTQTGTSFGRALDNSDSSALLRTGAVSYTATHWRSILELRSFQELNQIQPNEYEILPRLSIIGNRTFGVVRSSALLQATEFDKSSDINLIGSRIVIDVNVEIPLRTAWGFLTPGLRVIHRDYHLDDTLGNVRDDASITTTSTSLDMGLIFDKQTQLFGRTLLQTLEPRLHYLYTEEEFQDDLPIFDSKLRRPSYDGLFRGNRFTGYDRIGDANRVALGIATTFSDNSSGAQLFSASIGQIFHNADREVNLASARGVDPTADTSPIFVTLAAQLDRLRITASYEHDTDSNRSNRGFVSVKYRGEDDLVVNFNYAMTASSQQRFGQQRSKEETDLSFSWPLPSIGQNASNWQLLGRWNYDWDKRATIESLVGLEYNDCCWKARVVFRRRVYEPRVIGLITPGSPTVFLLDRRADSGIYFEFQLKGLTSLGGRLDRLLQNSIPGYLTGR